MKKLVTFGHFGRKKQTQFQSQKAEHGKQKTEKIENKANSKIRRQNTEDRIFKTNTTGIFFRNLVKTAIKTIC